MTCKYYVNYTVKKCVPPSNFKLTQPKYTCCQNIKFKGSTTFLFYSVSVNTNSVGWSSLLVSVTLITDNQYPLEKGDIGQASSRLTRHSSQLCKVEAIVICVRVSVPLASESQGSRGNRSVFIR